MNSTAATQSFSHFDALENVHILTYDLQFLFDSAISSPNTPLLPKLFEMKEKFQNITEAWESLTNELYSKIEEEKIKSKKFIETRCGLYEKNQKISEKILLSQTRILKEKNEELEDSLYRLKNMWRKNIEDMEISATKHMVSRGQIMSNYLIELEQIDKEINEVLSSSFIKQPKQDPSFSSEISSPPVSLISSKPYEITIDKASSITSFEFKKAMEGISFNSFVNNSKISIEKNEGEWNPDFDSEKEDSYSVDEIKRAIEILNKAQLLNKHETVEKLNEMVNKSGSTNMDFILDLMSISKDISNRKMPKKKLEIDSFQDVSGLEITTPRSSFFVQGNVLSTIQSPGHKAPINYSGEVLHDVKYDEIMNAPTLLEVLGLKDANEEFSVLMSPNNKNHQ
ncbi:unnamed protein product [Blepharisma stoltei]|uniref:Uncharacterized protein n=1 Tax=Blepharisma stoltei TaxID=1481888 RepID=A0AAU9K707_9CILI|nr:unnamed protein product [Blepharisma stoltei]